MKKNLLCLLLSLVVLSFCCSAAADVIWEPENNFYKSHAEECEYVDRSYLANGSEGYVAVYPTPKDKRPAEYLYNGSNVYVSYSWQGWGLVNYYDNQGELHFEDGWIRLESLSPDYDHEAFMAEHKEEMWKPEAPATLNLASYEAAYLWELPGTATAPWNMKSMGTEDVLSFRQVWTDEFGNDWGYVGYFYQNSGWVCLSAPETPNLPVTEPEVALYPAAASLPEAGANVDLTAIALLLAALVVLTVGIILLSYRKRIKKLH